MMLTTISLLMLLSAPPATTPPGQTAPNGSASPSAPHIVEPSPVLPGRPDAAVPPGASGMNVLGASFESLSAGITFRSPAGFSELRNVNGAGDEVVSFTNDAKREVLKVNKLAYVEPIPMTYHKKDPNKPDGPDVNGLFEETIDRLKTDTPNIDIKKAEIERRGVLDVGTIIGRYNVGTETNLTMIGMVREHPAGVDAVDSAFVYFTFSFTIALPKETDLETSPAVGQAYETFNAVLDSVRLLDQTAVREDQDQRLYRTRTLYVNLTEAKLKSTIAHEEWLRIIREGKDVGYSYVVEETGRDLPRAGRAGSQQVGGQEGVLIGVRSRTTQDSGAKVEAESWMWTSYDRKHEKWSNVAIVDDAKSGKDGFGDVGSSDVEVRIVHDEDLLPGERMKGKAGRAEEDKSQPAVRQRESISLNVTHVGKGLSGAPITRQLPPWYLPQAISHLLPRLLTRQQGKSFLFATYNGEAHEVMMRYVDVGQEQTCQLNGASFRAIPITDRLGLEGSKTMHYVSFDGKYLGSFNADQKITILPTDATTLEKMWKDANLTRPGDVGEKK